MGTPDKVCITCGLPSDKFVGNKCRDCVSAYSLEYYHRVKESKGIKPRVHKTKEERDEHRRQYERKRDREKAEKEGRKFTPNRKRADVTDEQRRKEDAARSKKYKQLNPEKRRESAREWAKRNSKKNQQYTRRLYHTDPEFNIKSKIRSRIGLALKKGHSGSLKDDYTISYLGCTYSFFKNYIESKFTDGMSWELVLNASIHLDHIRPCASFTLTDKEQQKMCFNYKNVQPMWALDNLRKGAKYEEPTQAGNQKHLHLIQRVA